MKRKSIYRGYIGKGYSDQSEFSHRYAAWAQNHRGWAKMKVYNRRMAKRREKRREKRNSKQNINDEMRFDNNEMSV